MANKGSFFLKTAVTKARRRAAASAGCPRSLRLRSGRNDSHPCRMLGIGEHSSTGGPRRSRHTRGELIHNRDGKVAATGEFVRPQPFESSLALGQAGRMSGPSPARSFEAHSASWRITRANARGGFACGGGLRLLIGEGELPSWPGRRSREDRRLELAEAGVERNPEKNC